ncbi:MULTISPECIES: DUF3105 domain-containing protein [unclassified Streptomyces]|uniref:DUF3105 domain-containing protein n=1 Tax=unclassified Streptomyces TaxID=2593676 RepID=UPI001F041D3D|nr:MULTISPECIES: DUF3105 domain-containing protein [unclassified Streptomyces]MCH0564988.1 DUF3105 domain-containing protein [Streptomyces sp. MUM 2J]MCH0571173.1 DUF3105 domain-containing protein [Streptomyces sp. MUM 136J]
MGSANDSSSAARRARIEEARRAGQAPGRRRRVLAVTVGALVAAALVVGGVLLVTSAGGKGADAAGGAGKNSGPATAGDGDSAGAGHFVTGADGVRTWQGELSRKHVTAPVHYPMEPPVGGDHDPVWAECDGTVYTKALKNGNAVHSLEHGAVWVTYNGEAAGSDVEALAAKVERTPYTMMSPYPDQRDPIVLTAWGHQRSVKSAGDPAVDAFLAAYVQGEQTPEPGATCSGGMMR